MKIPEMAWITQINYALSYSCVYCIYVIIQNVYIFCLLIHIPGASKVCYFCDCICVFSVRGCPLASSMNEKDITPRFHRQGLNPVLD